jgi:heavy metal sensor kinase
MTQSIRVRLTLWFVGLLTLLLLIFAGIITFAEARNERVELEEMLRVAIRWGATAAERSNAVETLTPLSLPDAILCVRLLSPSGSVARTLADPEGIGASLPRSLPARTWETARLPDGRQVRVFRQAGPGHTIVEAAGAMTSHQELLRLLTGIAIASPPTLAAALLAALFLSERALRPMGAITRLARDLSAGDLGRRIALQGPEDEIKELADTLDAMLIRLEQAFAAQQRFVGDASHELRTPLTIMRGHVDVALADSDASPAELRRCLEIITAELCRLSRLVEDLLTLQRADAGTHHLAPERLDLGALAEEVGTDLQALAAGRRLSCHCTPGVCAWLDPAWFRQLLINLIDNAIRLTPRGGAITVTVRADGARAIVDVEDTGVGIAAEHLPHLFERFYRVESERTRTHGGAGLGLAIVTWIVEVHGGTVGVDSVPGRGTRFTMTFPKVPPEAHVVGNRR